MRERFRLLALTGTFGFGVAIGVIWWPGPMFLFMVAGYIAAQFFPMPTPTRLGVSMAPALAGAVALTSHGSVVLVLGTLGTALPLSRLLVHLLHGRRVGDERFPSEPVGIGVFGGLFAVAALVIDGQAAADATTLAAYAIAAGGGYVASSAMRSISSGRDRGLPRRLCFFRALSDWPAHAVLYSAAALYAVTAPVMGPWSLLLAGLPYAFGYISLHRLQATRHTLDQTIRALGRIPEAGGMVPLGHAGRTAELAVAVGGDLGLGGRALDRVEYAALLHDIGRLVLANPSVAAGHHTPSDVSGWGATIIGEAKHLAQVADLVAVMHSPYRRPGEQRDPALSREAHVVRVVSAYDDEIAAGRAPLEAIETLHRGAAYDFDPEVVTMLRRVLERRGAIAA